MWLKVEGFPQKIREWWQGYSIRGSPELRNLKRDITGWNQDSFGKLEVQKGRLLDDLSVLEQSAEGRLVTQLEKERSLHLKLRLQEIAKIQATVQMSVA